MKKLFLSIMLALTCSAVLPQNNLKVDKYFLHEIEYRANPAKLESLTVPDGEMWSIDKIIPTKSGGRVVIIIHEEEYSLINENKTTTETRLPFILPSGTEFKFKVEFKTLASICVLKIE